MDNSEILTYAQLNQLLDVAQNDIEASTAEIEKSANNIKEIRDDNQSCRMICNNIKQQKLGIIEKIRRRNSHGSNKQ